MSIFSRVVRNFDIRSGRLDAVVGALSSLCILRVRYIGEYEVYRTSVCLRKRRVACNDLCVLTQALVPSREKGSLDVACNDATQALVPSTHQDSTSLSSPLYFSLVTTLLLSRHQPVTLGAVQVVHRKLRCSEAWIGMDRHA